MANGMSSDITQTKVRQLSIDAKSFIPANVRMDETPRLDRPVHKAETQWFPQYAASCYPFRVPAGPRPAATWQGPGRPKLLYDSDKFAGLKNTLHSDNTFVPAPKMPYGEFRGRSQPRVFVPHQYNPQEIHDTQTLCQFHTLPSGHSPWNVQYTGPFQFPAAEPTRNIWMVTSDCLSDQGTPSLLQSGTPMTQVHAIPVHNRLSKSNPGQCKVKKMGLNRNQVSVGIQYEMAGQETDLKEKALNRPKTMICKDCATQTDFSSDVSNKNLEALPCPFYDASSHGWQSEENSTDSEELDYNFIYAASPWKRQFQIPGTSIASNGSIFLPSVHSDMYTLDYEPLLENDTTPVSCVYVPDTSDYGGVSDAFTYQTLEDPGMKLMPLHDAGFSIGHRRTGCELSAAFSNGACWSPVACAVPSQGPLLEANTPHLRNQRLRWYSKKGTDLNISQDTNRNTCQTHSVGTDAVLGGLRDVEDDFPKLLLAAGGLLSPCSSLEGTGNRKSSLTRAENFEHSKWTDASSSKYDVKKSAVVATREGHVKSATKKKQKRQEQLSHAADVELAEISLEQQVLREISSGHRRLVPSFPPPDGFLLPDSVGQNPSHKLDSIESIESGGLATHCAQPEMVTLSKVFSKEEKEKLTGNLEITLQTTSMIDHLKVSIDDESIPLNNIELSQSTTSSKTSSMDTGGRGTPASTNMSPISQTSPLSMSSPTGSPFGSGITSPRNELTELNKFSIISQIHSPRFREYCNQVLSREIDECCTELLQRLVRFQDRYFQCDRANRAYSVKRRTVLGLREVTKHLKMSHLSCVIISPNMEITQSKGGLDKALHNIIKLCEEHKVLFVFALGRHALGRACAKLVPVSVVGIFSCDGAEEHFQRLQKLTRRARSAYQEMVATLLRSNGTNGLQQTPVLNSGHSRTPSRCSLMSVTSSILSEPISENDPETDSPAEGEPVKETTCAEAEKFLDQGFMENGRHDAKSHSDEPALTGDESSDEETVFDEKLYYEADSEDERLALDTTGSKTLSCAFTPNSDKNAFQDLSTNYDSDSPAQVLVRDLLPNSVQGSMIRENGHSNESSEAHIMKMNILPGTKLNECSQYLTKSKNNHFESWLTD